MLDLGTTVISVRWRLPLSVAIVAPLVTRLWAASAWPSGCKLSARPCSRSKSAA